MAPVSQKTSAEPCPWVFVAFLLLIAAGFLQIMVNTVSAVGLLLGSLAYALFKRVSND